MYPNSNLQLPRQDYAIDNLKLLRNSNWCQSWNLKFPPQIFQARPGEKEDTQFQENVTSVMKQKNCNYRIIISFLKIMKVFIGTLNKGNGSPSNCINHNKFMRQKNYIKNEQSPLQQLTSTAWNTNVYISQQSRTQYYPKKLKKLLYIIIYKLWIYHHKI